MSLLLLMIRAICHQSGCAGNIPAVVSVIALVALSRSCVCGPLRTGGFCILNRLLPAAGVFKACLLKSVGSMVTAVIYALTPPQYSSKLLA